MPVMKGKRLFDSQEFGYSVWQKMLKLDISFRQAQEATGIDQASIHRITTGKPPNVENYLRLTKWLEQEKKKSVKHSSENINQQHIYISIRRQREIRVLRQEGYNIFI